MAGKLLNLHTVEEKYYSSLMYYTTNSNKHRNEGVLAFEMYWSVSKLQQSAGEWVCLVDEWVEEEEDYSTQ